MNFQECFEVPVPADFKENGVATRDRLLYLMKLKVYKDQELLKSNMIVYAKKEKM